MSYSSRELVARNNWRFDILGNISTVALKRKWTLLHHNLSPNDMKRFDILGNISTVALNRIFSKDLFEGFISHTNFNTNDMKNQADIRLHLQHGKLNWGTSAPLHWTEKRWKFEKPLNHNFYQNDMKNLRNEIAFSTCWTQLKIFLLHIIIYLQLGHICDIL